MYYSFPCIIEISLYILHCCCILSISEELLIRWTCICIVIFPACLSRVTHSSQISNVLLGMSAEASLAKITLPPDTHTKNTNTHTPAHNGNTFSTLGAQLSLTFYRWGAGCVKPFCGYISVTEWLDLKPQFHVQCAREWHREKVTWSYFLSANPFSSGWCDSQHFSVSFLINLSFYFASLVYWLCQHGHIGNVTTGTR